MGGATPTYRAYKRPPQVCALTQGAGHAKVSKQHCALVIHQQISGLDIAVDVTVLVQIEQPFKRLF